MTPSVVDRLKEHGLALVIWPPLIAGVAQVFYAIRTGQSEQQLTANAVLTVIAASGIASGAIDLFVIASLKKTEFGELAEFKFPLILGVTVGMMVSAIKLLSLFGLKFAVECSPK